MPWKIASAKRKVYKKSIVASNCHALNHPGKNNMQIVWNPEAVENLKNSHTLLELETFHTDAGSLKAWCVVPAEKLLEDLPNLENLIQLHQQFLVAAVEKNYTVCQDLAQQLIGRFGGELDTFYQEILSRNK